MFRRFIGMKKITLGFKIFKKIFEKLKKSELLKFEFPAKERVHAKQM